jgi:hypothetical protein
MVDQTLIVFLHPQGHQVAPSTYVKAQAAVLSHYNS